MKKKRREENMRKIEEVRECLLEALKEEGIFETCFPIVVACIKTERGFESLGVGEKNSECDYYDRCLDVARKAISEVQWTFSCEKCPHKKKKTKLKVTDEIAWAMPGGGDLEEKAPEMDF